MSVLRSCLQYTEKTYRPKASFSNWSRLVYSREVCGQTHERKNLLSAKVLKRNWENESLSEMLPEPQRKYCDNYIAATNVVPLKVIAYLLRYSHDPAKWRY